MTGTYQTTIIVFLFTISSLAQAYVGPGAGLSAVGSIVAFIGAFLLLIIGFIWYPIKRLLKRNQKNVAEGEIAPGETTPDETTPKKPEK